ncbi:proton-conducting transporter membrane subunit [uncultured Thiohalocapsa sp.]|uniref:proton-conducting transporter transmembrane domain-containing protein n=1 Tax=uncultured Thiohalocapsa sp. TaxID=768990 RepID=UPI0025FA5E47|nr:proton-conducting transporter membrane subunit [uncultured Thiohalocapsa sp.]
MNGPGADMAWQLPVPWLTVLAPLWPLALLAALALPPLRAPALRLAPWAALPALLVAIAAPAAVLPLPGLLLGGSLLLDATGRWLLAAVGLLWLAAGWLAADWLHTPPRATAFLLAMAGALWLPLAADLPSFLAASVLAAYPLYGLLGGGRGGGGLLVSVVIADLLILEALLLLAKGGAGLDFGSLRTALAAGDDHVIVLALLLLGCGAKAGLMGLHYWLAPAAQAASSPQLAPMVAFTLAAGLLPLWRLLPITSVHWPSAAALLAWLTLGGCLWAVVAGLLQSASRALIAYLLSALAALWLGLMGMGMGLGLDPSAAPDGIRGFLPAAFALSGIGVAALLLADGAAARHGRLVGWGLALACALLIVGAVLGALLVNAAGGDAPEFPLLGSLVCVGLLLGASVAAAGGARSPERGGAHRVSAALVAVGLVLLVLAVGSLAAMAAAADAWSPHRLGAPVAALLGALAAGPGAAALLARLPRMPAGDLVVVLAASTARLVAGWDRLGTSVAGWREGLGMAGERMRHRLTRLRTLEQAEAGLRRWSTATLLLLVTAAALALLVRSG